MNDKRLNNNKLIKNYATALFGSSDSSVLQEKILEQIIIIDQIINNDVQISKFMYSPIVRVIDKISIVTLLIQNFKIQPIIQQFLHVLVKNGHMSIFSSIISRYRKLLNDSKNIKMVELISSKVLNVDEKNWFQNYLEKLLNKKISLNFCHDESILGGIIIQYDSILIDCSIAGALNKITKAAKKLGFFNHSKNTNNG